MIECVDGLIVTIYCGVQVLDASVLQIAAPTLLARDTTSVTVQWSPPSDTEPEGYRLRYRAEDSLDWTYVDTTLKNTQVKKKSLEVGVNYYFSVLPVLSVQTTRSSTASSVFDADTTTTPSESSTSSTLFEYSPQSLPLQVQQFSSFMKNLFPDKLVARDGSTKDTAGK
jgi:hypothetical protein